MKPNNYSEGITSPSEDNTSLSAQLIKTVGPVKAQAILAVIQNEASNIIEAIRANGQAERLGKGLPVQTRADIKNALENAVDSIGKGRTDVARIALKEAKRLDIKDPAVLALIEKMAIKCGLSLLTIEQNRIDAEDTGKPSYPPSGNSAVLH